MGIGESKQTTGKDKAIKIRGFQMLYDVINAEYIESYKLKIEFEDGSAGIVDFSDYLEKGGVFAKFKDLDFFKNFIVSGQSRHHISYFYPFVPLLLGYF